MNPKPIAIAIMTLFIASSVFAWGEGNSDQSYFIHWQPQEESCSIPSTFFTIGGYLWTNQTTKKTECMPFHQRNRAMSQLSGDTLVVPAFSSSTQSSTPNTTAQVTIKQGFPKDADYVFVCDTNLSYATYDWEFGDGQKLYDVSREIYHTFDNPGTYQVTCVANDGTSDIPSWMQVTVTPQQTAPHAMLYIREQGNDSFDFVCQERGFVPDHVDWDFGDGTTITSTSHEVIHVYHDGNADHQVECTARNNGTSASDFIWAHN